MGKPGAGLDFWLCYWRPIWFRTRDMVSTPHSLHSRTWGERGSRVCQELQHSPFFHQIRRLCSRQCLRLMCHCLSPLRLGYKKSFSSRPTLTIVNAGISRDSWSWKQGRGLGECDKVWKWIRFWHKCPKVLGKLQGPEATEENQNTHVGFM